MNNLLTKIIILVFSGIISGMIGIALHLDHLKFWQILILVGPPYLTGRIIGMLDSERAKQRSTS